MPLPQLLLDNGVSPTDSDGFHRTPLHYAAYQGDIAVMEMLFAGGAENSMDVRVAFSLWPWCCHPIVGGAAIPQDCDGEGWTPLHLAAAKGRMVCALFLLDSGANPTRRDKQRRTPVRVEHPILVVTLAECVTHAHVVVGPQADLATASKHTELGKLIA